MVSTLPAVFSFSRSVFPKAVAINLTSLKQVQVAENRLRC